MVGNTTTNHASGSLGAIQGDAIRNVSGDFLPGHFRAHAGVAKVSGPFAAGNPCSASHWDGSSGWCALAADGYRSTDSGYVINGATTFLFNMSYQTPTSNEIRPVNTAVRYLIRSKP